MTKNDKTQKIRTQLEKLTKLLQQDQQFHQKYILQLLSPSTNTNHQDDPLCSSQTIQFTNKIKQFYTQEDLSEESLSQIFNENSSQFCTNDFQLCLQSQVNAQRNQDGTYTGFQFDKQITAKQIQCHFNFDQLNNELQKSQEDQPTILMTPYYKKSERSNNKRQDVQNASHYYDSVAPTETIEISFQKQKTLQEEKRKILIEDEIYSQNHTKKPSEENIGNIKEVIHQKSEKGSRAKVKGKITIEMKRPMTSGKQNKQEKLKQVVSNSDLRKNRNEVEMSRKMMYDKNAVKKMRSKGREMEQKKMTKRDVKTKRQLQTGDHPDLKEAENTNIKEQQKKCRNLKSREVDFKKAQRAIVVQKTFSEKRRSGNDMCEVKADHSNNRLWFKSSDKFTKKLNRVNIKKLQQNYLEKDKSDKDHVRECRKMRNDMQGLNKCQQVEIKNKKTENQVGLNINKKHVEKKSCPMSPYQQDGVSSSFKKGETISKRIDSKEMGKQKLAEMEKLNFDSKVPIMERIIEHKNIFKFYNIQASNYIECVKSINSKYLKKLEQQIKILSDEAVFKMKIFTSIVTFFTQFFKPTSKNLLGLIAKNYLKQVEQMKQLFHKSQVLKNCIPKQMPLPEKITKDHQPAVKIQVSNDTLIISLLQKPKDLLSILQTLPSRLYHENHLSEESINQLVECYREIDEKIDKNGNFELFSIKRSKIFHYYHELVQFIKFLIDYGLIEKTQRANLTMNKSSMLGYYSSRSRRETRKKNGNCNNKEKDEKKGCDSERKITIQGIETDRTYFLETKMPQINNINKIKAGKEERNRNGGRDKKQAKANGADKIIKMSHSREKHLKEKEK